MTDAFIQSVCGDTPERGWRFRLETLRTFQQPLRLFRPELRSQPAALPRRVYSPVTNCDGGESSRRRDGHSIDVYAAARRGMIEPSSDAVEETSPASVIFPGVILRGEIAGLDEEAGEKSFIGLESRRWLQLMLASEERVWFRLHRLLYRGRV